MNIRFEVSEEDTAAPATASEAPSRTPEPQTGGSLRTPTNVLPVPTSVPPPATTQEKQPESVASQRKPGDESKLEDELQQRKEEEVRLRAELTSLRERVKQAQKDRDLAASVLQQNKQKANQLLALTKGSDSQVKAKGFVLSYRFVIVLIAIVIGIALRVGK